MNTHYHNELNSTASSHGFGTRMVRCPYSPLLIGEPWADTAAIETVKLEVRKRLKNHVTHYTCVTYSLMAVELKQEAQGNSDE